MENKKEITIYFKIMLICFSVGLGLLMYSVGNMVGTIQTTITLENHYSIQELKKNQSNQIKPTIIEPLFYERTACIYLGYVDDYSNENRYFRSEECYMIN